MSGRMTIEGFIAWCLTLPDPKRWELHDGRPIQRPASWRSDGLLKGALLGRLGAALEDDSTHGLLAFGPLLVTGPATVVEPHFVIAPAAGVKGDDVVLRDPVTVVEVVRADGPAEHWAPRLRAYAALPTVRHVVAVHAAARTALHLRRASDGTIAGRLLRGGAVALDPPGVALDLDRTWTGAGAGARSARADGHACRLGPRAGAGRGAAPAPRAGREGGDRSLAAPLSWARVSVGTQRRPGNTRNRRAAQARGGRRDPRLPLDGRGGFWAAPTDATLGAAPPARRPAGRAARGGAPRHLFP